MLGGHGNARQTEMFSPTRNDVLERESKFCEKISAIFYLRFLTERKRNRLAFGTDAFVVLIF